LDNNVKSELIKSLSGIFWKEKELDQVIVDKLITNYAKSKVFAKLVSRSISSIDQLEKFCAPKIKNHFINPFVLKDMKEAVQRLHNAILKGEKICLYADYDVDGATSCTIMAKLLTLLSADFFIYVPNRITEGYGLSNTAIEKLSLERAKLIITLDCGTSSEEEIAYAKSLGIDIIVIDHHLTNVIPKDAIAVVNPNRPDENTDLKYLAAVGVTYLFATALKSVLKDCPSLSSKVENLDFLTLLDLVALGTVCDVVPLIGLNRAFVHQGLKVLNKRINIGLASISDAAGIKTQLSTYHLGFMIGPRINAASRMGNSQISIQTLCSDSRHLAEQLAVQLNEYNKDRQSIEGIMLQEAIQMVDSMLNETKLEVIILDNCNWHIGVIGILSGRLKEIYNVPTIIIAWENDIGKASCRSMPGIDLGKIILNAKSQGLLISGGGHKMAAGFSIAKNQLENFKKFINDSIGAAILASKLEYIKNYNVELHASAINVALIKEIQTLEPFGSGNEEPVFKVDGLKLIAARSHAYKHVFCTLGSKDDSSVLIYAAAYKSYNNLIGKFLLQNPTNCFSILCKISLNSYKAQENVNCVVEDIIIE
jgi:single-stranded-DNA-specific exonuclease